MVGTSLLKEELEKLEHPNLLLVGARTFSTPQTKVIPANVDLQYPNKETLISALLAFTEGDPFECQVLFVQIILSRITDEQLIQLLELDYFMELCEDNEIPYEENTENSINKKGLAVDLVFSKDKFNTIKESFIEFEIQYAINEELDDEDLVHFSNVMTLTLIHFLLNEDAYRVLSVLEVLDIEKF